MEVVVEMVEMVEEEEKEKKEEDEQQHEELNGLVSREFVSVFVHMCVRVCVCACVYVHGGEKTKCLLIKAMLACVCMCMCACVCLYTQFVEKTEILMTGRIKLLRVMSLSIYLSNCRPIVVTSANLKERKWSAHVR